jgi:hypothetical protein
MDPELKGYLEERFERIDRRFEQVDQRFSQIDQRFAQSDQRFAQIDYRLTQMDQRIERVEVTGRQTLVVVEGLRHEVQLVAEAFVGLSDRMDVFQKETKLELEKAPAWLEPYFRGLDIHVKGLESVVEHRQGDIMDTVRMMLGEPPLKPSPAGE